MLHLVTHLMAFPEFFKYLQAFGQKDYARDEGFSGFNMSMSRNAAGEPTRIGKEPSVLDVSSHQGTEVDVFRVLLHVEICRITR